MELLAFYCAIKKAMDNPNKGIRRTVWPKGQYVFYRDDDGCKDFIVNTGTEFKKYTPSEDDMVANDWYAV